MPGFRGITLGVNSQFDVEQVPEFAPPKKPGFPKLLENNVASVYIQSRPGAQFWVCYSLSEPEPPSAYFFFKLSINDTDVVSWGVGKEEDYQGKTMHALYEATETWNARSSATERRGFFFAANSRQDDNLEGNYGARFEIRVYRAAGRQRIAKDMNQYRDTIQGRKRPTGLEILSVGQVKKEQPKRFYKYALVDPVDMPYATFRYYYKTLDELKRLEILRVPDGSDESYIDSYLSLDLQDSMENVQGPEGVDGHHSETSLDSSSKAPEAHGNQPDEDDIEDDKFGFVGRPKRLSIPPSRRLFPTTNSSFPMSLFSRTTEDTVETHDREAWRAPSPIRGGFRDIDSPTPGRKRSHTAEVWQDVVNDTVSKK
ncbi:hypothetical protein EJ05DRAFT_485944 [Pseudovirgaria hyperparasitica]|uniref:Uncharacterized protein n=1 Tax=Pseudovirgaria hyperparasitica TaxID=470096 RepID=A0A6A6W6N2_9PEZI|nr:uncharacterized protein EJ05DRAFT_485944 [Pseudovirgaria hyperparasitica]KAF2757859.1 hypothetical protein EJ05DRAFT_485944 [Pseudovirgaria hyperparasitica]